jgi:alkylated DNA repair dioxygenase AlkB
LTASLPLLAGVSRDCLEYVPGFLDPKLAADYLIRLRAELDWSQREIVLFGRRHLQPRLVAWHGDPGASYSYSGQTLHPAPWHPVLLDIRERLAACTAAAFNSVLANAYRDGSDSMGWHRDDEPELGAEPVIASVSLGAPRRLLIRERKRPSQGLTLEAGSLLLMQGEFQRRFRHALPKTRQAVGLRINLTYRLVRVARPGSE